MNTTPGQKISESRETSSGEQFLQKHFEFLIRQCHLIKHVNKSRSSVASNSEIVLLRILFGHVSAHLHFVEEVIHSNITLRMFDKFR